MEEKVKNYLKDGKKRFESKQKTLSKRLSININNADIDSDSAIFTFITFQKHYTYIFCIDTFVIAPKIVFTYILNRFLLIFIVSKVFLLPYTYV